eukprot:g3402.t1
MKKYWKQYLKGQLTFVRGGFIFVDRCCQSKDSCNAWKEHRARNGSAQSDLCHFHTNVCDTDGQLIRLSLENLNMECDFPYEEITQFTNLKKLLLKGNRFTGQIGTVLDELAELDNLEHLDIQGSKLTGSLPGRGAMETSGICSFARTHLWYLNLASNNISGQIPKCLLYERSKVKVINLCELTLPNCLSINRGLEVLDLSENQLAGSIPIVFTRSYVLEVLNLAKNRFTGEVPAEFGFSSPLMNLNLSRNNFSGTFPETITESRVIEFLDLSYNSLTGNLPDSIGNMARLRVLHLGSNKLTGLLPKSLRGLRSLHHLLLNQNSFTGTIVDVLPSSVAVLDLADNELNGTIPVDVFYNGRRFETISEIQSADLSNNAFIRFDDEWYEENTPTFGLILFSAANNSIKGKFPTLLTKAGILQALDLSNNYLRGPLPSNDHIFRSMRQLNLSSNRFVGHIPTSWESSGLFNVQSNASVDLSFNRLSGTLPDFFYETNMNQKFNRTVNLKGNDFDFDCPLPESHLTINGLVCDNDSSFAEPSLTDIEGESLKTISVSPAQGSLEGPEKSESISTHSMESEQSITVNTSSAEASGGAELSSLSVPSINEEEKVELQSSEGDSDDSINALWAPIVAAVGFALLLGLFLIIRRISKSKKAATAVANETAGGPGRRKPVPLISLSTLESSRALTPQPEPPRDDGVQMLIGMQSSAEI